MRLKHHVSQVENHLFSQSGSALHVEMLDDEVVKKNLDADAKA